MRTKSLYLSTDFESLKETNKKAYQFWQKYSCQIWLAFSICQCGKVERLKKIFLPRKYLEVSIFKVSYENSVTFIKQTTEQTPRHLDCLGEDGILSLWLDVFFFQQRSRCILKNFVKAPSVPIHFCYTEQTYLMLLTKLSS